MREYGLLQEKELHSKDYRVGTISGATREVLDPLGSYLNFLPEMELQRGTYVETMACVSFSALNCLETIQNVRGEQWNKSDRFLAKMSNTTKQGNYLRTVAETIRTKGVVEESLWSFDRAKFDWDTYYESIPQDVQGAGKEWLEQWDVSWEWLNPSDLKARLKYGPIQVGVYAWPRPTNGLYTDGGNSRRNHAVMLVEATEEYYTIYDHYDPGIKKLVPNYDFKFAMQFHLSPHEPKPMELSNNTLVQEVEETGQFGFHLDGKIIVDALDKLLATFIIRNDGDIEHKTVSLTKEQWGLFPKEDLKGNALT